MTRKRILEVLNALPGETFLYQHALAIQQYCPQVELVWAFSQTSKKGRLVSDDLPAIDCFAWPNYNLLPKWKQLIVKSRYLGNSENALHRPQYSLLKKLKPDLVHFHFSTLAVKYAHLCLKLNIPYTFSVRGSDLHLLHAEKDTDYLVRLKQVSEEAKRIHIVNTTLQQQFESLTQSHHTTVIRTTLNDSWTMIQRTPQPHLLVAIGRMTWQKGFPDLILAVGKLIRQNIPVQLAIIGEGPQRPEIEYMIRDLGLTQHIILTGKQTHSQIKEWLSKATAFVLSSVAEGFPNVLAEAMMAGVPVVTSDCGGIPELIEHRKHALVYPAGNIDNLADQLINALQQYDNSWIQHAKELSTKHFAMDTHADSFNKLWS